jgi:hypothetical protein
MRLFGNLQRFYCDQFLQRSGQDACECALTPDMVKTSSFVDQLKEWRKDGDSWGELGAPTAARGAFALNKLLPKVDSEI